MLFNSNNVQDPNSDLERSRLFINKIKEHRHNKIKEKHINKFERLYFKCHGYHHNLNRHAANLHNIDHQNTFSRHQNVPSSFSFTSNPTTVPATCMAPTPSSSTTDSNPAPGLPPSSHSYTHMDHTNKWVNSLSKIPLTKEQLSLLQKGPNFVFPPNTSHRSLHNSHRTSLFQTTSPGGG